MMVMGTCPVFIVTGILLWLPGNHFGPWLIHVGTGLVAPVLMIGHIYMAVVNPDTRVGLSGMITGRVDREWARHHYAVWYRDHFHEDGTRRDPDREAGPA
jgi:formate dehydrogenase subunit gamma